MLPPLILLAAGQSRRMGFPKGLVKVNGQPLIAHQFRRFEEAGGQAACVILAEGDDTYVSLIPNWVTILRNPPPDRGQFSSFQVGARWILNSPQTPSAFALPLDVPAPQTKVWQTLAAALADGIDVALPVFQDKGGHPLLLGRNFLARLAALPITERLDHQMHRLDPSALVRVPVEDPTILANWNTPTEMG